MSKNPQSDNIYHPSRHFFNRGPHSSTSFFSVTRAKNKLLRSKLRPDVLSHLMRILLFGRRQQVSMQHEPWGELHKIYLTALWCIVSEYEALVNKVFLRVVYILKSLQSGTPQHFSKPASLYYWQVASRKPGVRSRIERSTDETRIINEDLNNGSQDVKNISLCKKVEVGGPEKGTKFAPFASAPA